MWHKAEWMENSMRLVLTYVGLLVKLANNYTTKGSHNNIIIDYFLNLNGIYPIFVCLLSKHNKNYA